MPTDVSSGPKIPLADVANYWLVELAEAAGSSAIECLSGGGLLGERARLNGFTVPGRVSAGGGCRLLPTADGSWIAINLARPDDRDLLPALFGDATLDPASNADIARAVAASMSQPLVERGREMGLAIAGLNENAPLPAVDVLCELAPAGPRMAGPPLVLDLSALWAGPLAAHLLMLAGARVIKLETPARPDAMRDGDPALFALLNQGKASVAIDPRTDGGRAAWMHLLAQADVVIEAARPRALAQLGIDAEASLRARPGQVWITITAHGAREPGAHAVGFGDDCAVAGGLSRELLRVAGKIGFVGDALADPLTGIRAALEAQRALIARRTCRIALSMAGTVAEAIVGSDRLDADLRDWSRSAGHPFPAGEARPVSLPVRPLGADNHTWLPMPC